MKQTSIIFQFFIFIFLMSGCLQQTEKKYIIGFSQCCADLWREMMEEEMMIEMSFHPEAELIKKVAGNDSETQIQQIRELMEQEVDVLIVAPNETEPLTAVIEEAYDRGIPVVLMDRKINSEKYTAFISADNYEIGKMMGEYVVSRFNGKGKVLELQLSMNISPAIERSRGFRDALADFPELEIVEAFKTEGNTQKIQEELPALIDQFPEVDIIFGHTDFISQTAANLLRPMGKAGDIFFIGVDGIAGKNGGLQSIEDGILDATILYPSGGTEAIQLAMNVIRNQSFSKKNVLQTTVIDERNVRIMQLQYSKILAQQSNIERQNQKLNEQVEIYQNQRTFLYILLAVLVLSILLGATNLIQLKSKKEANQLLEQKNKEVVQQRNKIMEMAAETRQATEAKFKFFTNISHEFRTPLTLIQGAVDDMLGGEKSLEKRKDLGLIRKNSNRLLRLINQLMDFRKIENEAMQVHAAEQDLIGFLREIMSAFEKRAKHRNIDFTFFSRERKMKIWFDAGMLDKVVFNLLSNAFKFTKDGGRIHVIVIKDELNNSVVIKVEDNGRGMTKEHAENAFERFYQVETYSTQGTGLGLSLSKMLMELHHGKIEVESEFGVGTRFEITLLLGNEHFDKSQVVDKNSNTFTRQEYASDADIELKESSAVAPNSSKDQSVLVIEDNHDLQDFLQRKLSSQYEILQATDGNQGIDMAYEEIPDLIICDVMMPGKNGIELSKILKSDLRTAHIPIILLTAQSNREQQLEGLQTGADMYVTKPFDLDLLKENIKTLLRNRATLKERFIGEVTSTASVSDKLNKKFLNHFQSLVEANYSNPKFGVNDICAEIGLSRVQVYRKVKAILDCSVSDYIQSVRLEHAKYLLQEGELTIAEIAYQVGYTSPSYFSTAFKGKFGETPRAWRG